VREREIKFWVMLGIGYVVSCVNG